MEELCAQLSALGVETRLRNQRDGSINGISYHCNELSVTGYKLGRGYTWAAICSRLERNLHQQQVEQARLEAEWQRAADAVRRETQRLEQSRQRLAQKPKPKEAQERENVEAQQLEALEALELKRVVDAYFQAAPPNCSEQELATATKRQEDWSQKVAKLYRELSTLTEQIEAASFWQKATTTTQKSHGIAARLADRIKASGAEDESRRQAA